LKACRLKCKTPRIVEQYNKELQEQMEHHHLASQLESLATQANTRQLTCMQQREYETFDALTTKSKLLAKVQCQKLPVGQVLWCPNLSKAISQILYWKGIRKRLLHGQVGNQLLHRLACKGNIQHWPKHLQFDETIQKTIQKSYKRYGQLKEDKGRCDMWLASLIDTQATTLQV